MYLYILYSGLSFIFRWDINNIDHLPEYMKLFYVALLDVYNEIEEEMEKQGYHYRLHYAIEAVRHLYLCILFRLCLVPIKFKGNKIGKKIKIRRNKNGVKSNILFLFATLNQF